MDSIDYVEDIAKKTDETNEAATVSSAETDKKMAEADKSIKEL